MRGLWRTWFDRDLAVAGRVVYKEDGKLKQALVHVARPILSIPNLAIHLELDRDKFVFKKEDHLKPILASAAAARLNDPASVKEPDCPAKDEEGKLSAGVTGDHHSAFLKLIAEAAGTLPENIRDLELNLLDAQPAVYSASQSQLDAKWEGWAGRDGSVL